MNLKLFLFLVSKKTDFISFKSCYNIIFLSHDKFTMECSICFESFDDNEELVRTICNHIFCKECLIQWININDTCPVCRHCTPIPKNKIQKIIDNDLPLLPCKYKINRSNTCMLSFCTKSIKFDFTIDFVKILNGRTIIEKINTCDIKTVYFENDCININRRYSDDISVFSIKCSKDDSKKLIKIFNSMFYRYSTKYLNTNENSYLDVINQMQINYNHNININSNEYENYNLIDSDSDNSYFSD